MPVLLATYARCVDGRLADLKKRLEAAVGPLRAARRWLIFGQKLRHVFAAGTRRNPVTAGRRRTLPVINGEWSGALL